MNWSLIFATRSFLTALKLDVSELPYTQNIKGEDMKFANSLAILFLTTFISGCGAPPVAKLYDGPVKPDADVAVVKAVPNGPINAQFLMIRSTADVRLLGRFDRGPTRYPVELKLDPGSYYIALRCENGFVFAKPYIEVTLARGSTYYLSCFDTGPNEQQSRAAVLKIETHAVK